MNNSKVYITNFFPYQNYDGAFKHTNLSKEEAQCIMFKGFFPLRNLNKLCFEINEKIKDSKKNDLLLLTGKGILDGLVLWIWLMKHHAVKILIFNQQQDKYFMQALSVEDLANLSIGEGNG